MLILHWEYTKHIGGTKHHPLLRLILVDHIPPLSHTVFSLESISAMLPKVPVSSYFSSFSCFSSLHSFYSFSYTTTFSGALFIPIVLIRIFMLLFIMFPSEHFNMFLELLMSIESIMKSPKLSGTTSSYPASYSSIP